MKATCSECEGEVDVPDDALPGEIVSCPDCGASYEVVSISKEKVEIKPAEVEGEDWGE
ncbi:MAG: alpha-aminoadipate/glutamate carrier protein LysW/ArgW [Candidatus Bathyarchaeia archaeon]